MSHSWAKWQKTRQKLDYTQKNREIDGSYLCLQKIDKFWMWSVGNRKWKLCKFAETCVEKLVTMRELIFGGFQPFGTTVSLCTVSNFELVFVHHIVRVAFHFHWHQTRWLVMDFETDTSICNLNKIGGCGWAILNPVFWIFNQSQRVKKHPEYLVKMVAKIQNSGMGILGK